jgi:hypothetical protein
MTDSLNALVCWLAGEFDNQPQALEQPAWFVHLRLWHRPLPFQIDGCPALFAEQANAIYLDKPYRQRVVAFRPTETPEQFQAQYFACQDPGQVLGAGANPDRFQSLTEQDLELLPGCVLTVTKQEQSFKAEPPIDAKCCFQYQGETRQVILGFEVSEDTFLSYDRGVDPATGKALWGAIMGAYRFQKRQDFSAELV